MKQIRTQEEVDIYDCDKRDSILVNGGKSCWKWLVDWHEGQGSAIMYYLSDRVIT
jgi:hypothetical protein